MYIFGQWEEAEEVKQAYSTLGPFHTERPQSGFKPGMWLL